MHRFDLDRFSRAHAADAPQDAPPPLSARVTGTPGDDTLFGTEGADVMVGGDGDDKINDFAGGQDRLFGGAGDDLVQIQRHAGVKHTVSMDAGEGHDELRFSGDRKAGVKLAAGNGDDIIQVSSPRLARIDAGAGDDFIELGASIGAYQLVLGDGVDTVRFYGTGGAYTGSVTITDFEAGDGGDILRINDFLGGWLEGWSGDNPFAEEIVRLKQKDASALLQARIDGAWTTVASFSNTDAGAFTAYNFEGYGPDGIGGAGQTLRGSAGDDVMVGTVGHDRLDGRDGDDMLNGGGNGNDTLLGGRGDDTMQVERLDIQGPTNIYMDAGDGADWVTYRGASAFGAGGATLKGGAGADKIEGFTTDRLVIDAGADADDIWFSQAGAVKLTLGSGVDTVHIGPEVDEQTGQFILRGVTDITDFAAGDAGDVLDLYGYDYVSHGTGFHDPFHNGFLRLAQSGTATLLQIDADGGGDEWTTWIRFAGADADDFTSHNFKDFEV